MNRLSLPALLLIPACVLSTEPNLGGMPIHDFSASAGVVLTADVGLENDTVRVHIRVRNVGVSLGVLEFGACSFAVRGAGLLGRSWDNRLPVNAGCPDIGLRVELEPGETRDRLVYARAAADLRDTVPPGRYTVSVYYRDRNSGDLERLRAGTLDL